MGNSLLEILLYSVVLKYYKDFITLKTLVKTYWDEQAWLLKRATYCDPIFTVRLIPENFVKFIKVSENKKKTAKQCEALYHCSSQIGQCN